MSIARRVSASSAQALSLGGGPFRDEERAQPGERLAPGRALGEPPQALADARRVLERLGDLQRLRERAVGEERLVPMLERLRAGPQPEEARRPGAGPSVSTDGGGRRD